MYFAAFPKIYYDGKGDGHFKVVTNFLRRVAVRTKLKTHGALFDTYDVKEGETPEMIAHKLYGDSEYHWVVLLMNDVIDRFRGWPMSTPQFLAFVEEKYDSADDIHHYEIDSVSGPVKKIDIGKDNTDYPMASIVTNIEFEEAEQDKKRKIKLLDPRYLEQFTTEYKAIMSESQI